MIDAGQRTTIKTNSLISIVVIITIIVFTAVVHLAGLE